MPFMRMSHDVDPKDQIWKEIGDLQGVELFNNQVLLATYKRSEKTKSGLYLPDKHRDEDRFQSKVGLLLMLGPSAFEDNAEGWFRAIEKPFAVNDWLVHRPSDGWSINIHGVDCRILVDTQIKMRVKDPDQVW